MFCPALFGIDLQTLAADIGRLGGAMVVTVSVIAMGEVVRFGRYLNLLLGLGVTIGPWLSTGTTVPYAATCAVLGLLVAGLAVPRGPKKETYGSWDRYVI